MRGTRAYWLLSGYLLCLSLVLFFRYTRWWNETNAAGGGYSSGAKIGEEFFTYISVVQGFLVAFITPAITSGAITIEKEQRTLEMLELTRLSRGAIVAGKLFSSVSFVALLLISSLPLTCLCFFLGGVAPEQVLSAYLLLLGGSFVAGALGLAWSSVARTTAAAILYTYVSIVLPIALFFLWQAVPLIVGFRNSGSVRLDTVVMGLGIAGLFGIGGGSINIAGTLTGADLGHFFRFAVPPWAAPLCTYLLVGVTLAAVATARLETYPERRAPVLRRLVLLFMGQQTLFLCGLRFSAFWGGSSGRFAVSMAYLPILSLLIYPLVLLMLLVPVFATGEVAPEEARSSVGLLLSGWTRKAWRGGKVASGLPYLCLLAGVVFGVYAFSCVVSGQAVALSTGNGSPGSPGTVLPSTPPPNALSGYVPPSINTSTFSLQEGTALKMGIVVAATFLGMASLGLLFSLLTRNRWIAMSALYGTLFFIVAVPATVYTNSLNSSTPSKPGLLINLYYLNPLFSLAEMTDTTGTFWDTHPLIFGTAPIWGVTTVTYLALTLLTLAVLQFAAGKMIRRR